MKKTNINLLREEYKYSMNNVNNREYITNCLVMRLIYMEYTCKTCKNQKINCAAPCNLRKGLI